MQPDKVRFCRSDCIVESGPPAQLARGPHGHVAGKPSINPSRSYRHVFLLTASAAQMILLQNASIIGHALPVVMHPSYAAAARSCNTSALI